MTYTYGPGLDPQLFTRVLSEKSVAGSNINALADSATLWGQGIPTTWGLRKVKGGVLQIGNINRKEYFKEGFYMYGGSSGRTANGTTTEYFYYYDMAVALGYPGDFGASKKIVKRIWVDGVVKYDSSKPKIGDPLFTLHEGSPTQAVDPILSRSFADQVAYRGLIYLVLEDQVVEQRVYVNPPQVDVEFYDFNTNTMPVTTTTVDQATSLRNDTAGYDYQRDIIYVLGVRTGGVNCVFKIGAASQVNYGYADLQNNLAVGAWTDANTLTASVAFFSGPGDADKYMIGQASLNNVRRIVLINCETGLQVASTGIGGIIPDMANLRYGPMDRWQIFDNKKPDKPRIFAFGINTLLESQAVIFKVYDNGPQLTKLWSSTDPIYNGAYISPSVTDKLGNTFAFIGRGTTVDKVQISASDTVLVTTGFATVTYSVQAALPTADGCFVLFCATGGNSEILKIDVNTGSVLWRVTGNPVLPSGDIRTWVAQSFTGGKYISWYATSNASIMTLDMSSGAYTVRSDVSGISWGSFQGFYDAVSGALMLLTGTTLKRVLPNTPAGADVSLSTFLTQLCVVGGYQASDVTVTGISDTITGAYINPPFDLRDTLNNLAAVYNFEVYESGGKIKIAKRNYAVSASPDFSLTADDRALLAEGTQTAYPSLKTTRVSDDKIPNTITLKYIDPDYDYQLVTFTWQRPLGTNGSSSSENYTVPLIMSATKAANLVNNMIYTKWGNRMTKEFRLGQRFLTLDPGDMIKFTDNGYSDFIKVDKVTINGDFSISVEGTTVQTDTISTPAFTDDGASLPIENSAPNDGRATAIPIDVPPINMETPNNADLSTYVVAVPASRGQLLDAIIQKGIAGAFSDVAEVIGPAYGLMTSVLADAPANTIDYMASLTFRLLNGKTTDFSTVTELQMLNGANRLLIGKPGRFELIGFTTVVADTTKQQVTLTGIIRGLNGTDWATGLHQFGDYAILFDADRFYTDVVDVSAYNSNVEYRAAGPAFSILSAVRTAFKINGNSDKPFTVGDQQVTIDGSNNLTLTWKRRSRSKFTLTDQVGTPPLDEVTEAYELEILNNTGTVVRTVTGLTTPTYTYTAANQATDGFTPPLSSLRVKVYQMSAALGRGFTKDTTVYV